MREKDLCLNNNNNGKKKEKKKKNQIIRVGKRSEATEMQRIHLLSRKKKP